MKESIAYALMYAARRVEEVVRKILDEVAKELSAAIDPDGLRRALDSVR